MVFPQPKFPFRHRMPVQIRFTDIDMLGHLNNSIYLQFMDLAKVQYFADANGGPVDMHNIDIVIANINANFLSQTVYGEELDVLTQVESVGNKSMVLQQQVVERHSGQLKCMASTVMVGIDLTTGVTQPIQQHWIDAFSAMEGRPVK